MKKFIFTLLMFCCSLSYAMPYVEIRGLTVVPLNRFESNSLKIYAQRGSAISAGICRIVIRDNGNALGDYYRQLAARFKFTHTSFGQSEEITPIVTDTSIMFKLVTGDFGDENFDIVTKDGKSIGHNITEIFNNNTVAIMAGPCYYDSAQRNQK